jgi:hypothetical protein
MYSSLSLSGARLRARSSAKSMWGIYGWGVTRGENAKTPPLLTGFSAVLWIERTPMTKWEKIIKELQRLGWKLYTEK